MTVGQIYDTLVPVAKFCRYDGMHRLVEFCQKTGIESKKYTLPASPQKNEGIWR